MGIANRTMGCPISVVWLFGLVNVMNPADDNMTTSTDISDKIEVVVELYANALNDTPTVAPAFTPIMDPLKYVMVGSALVNESYIED